MIIWFISQYKPSTCQDKADNGDIVSVHYTVSTPGNK